VAFAFEKLLVYQKAVSFADEIASLTESFPRGYFFLADQLSRAALSIAANIAEGNGRFTKADRRNFFGIARGSVQECVPLLEPNPRRCHPRRTRCEPSSVNAPLRLPLAAHVRQPDCVPANLLQSHYPCLFRRPSARTNMRCCRSRSASERATGIGFPSGSIPA
jgi:hypothetical protein